MKKSTLLASYLVALCAAQAQTRPAPHDWSVTLKIVDDVGSAVPSALVWVSYEHRPAPNQSKDWGQIRGLADTNGVFTASHRDQSVVLGLHAEKDGYYQTSVQHFLGFDPQNKSVNWYPTQTMVLTRVGTPIPMYANLAEAKFTKEDEAMGFDLEAGDWVQPLGTGSHVDMLFTARRTVKGDSDYTGELQLAFPNVADGLHVIAPVEEESQWLLRTAPDQEYQPTRTWRYTPTTAPEPVRGYFFRVRSLVDESGRVKSALYGKITGDIRFFVGTKAAHPGMAFTYYLNPTPNDRNVEFDPKHNLLPGSNVQEP